MTVRALALSGGGARGSFQMGALAAIYDVYGFRPNVIAGTSVGSVNGIKLAVATPPAVNDPAAILASVAAGNPDSGLTALRALEALWERILATGFFAIQPVFAGTMIQDVATSMNTETSGEPPQSAKLGAEIDKLSVLLSIPIVSTVTGPMAAEGLQKLKGTVAAVLSENAIFNLDPIDMLLTDETLLKLTDLAAGTPFYMATVAVESGRLRYIDGMGNFTERDGSTPVVSAMTVADIANALDENLNPLSAARRVQINGVLTRYQNAIGAIRAQRTAYPNATTRTQRLAIMRDMARNMERATYLLDALHAQIRGLRLTVRVDPRRGVLASAAIPVFFDPIVFGGERYVDGGLRELIPMEIAIRNRVTDIVGICCSPLELPAVDEMTNAGLPAIGLRALTEIALNEVTYSDIEAARATGIKCTVIAPTFNVHSSFVMNPTLIEMSSEYGWMRACDEMQPAADADRTDFRRLSDLITTFRMRSYRLELYINDELSFYTAVDMRDPFATLRTYRWIIRELLATRAGRGLPQHPQSRRWWWSWARVLRDLGRASIWSRTAVTSHTGVEILVADGVVEPDAYAPTGSLVDGGNDRVYWIVRGAVFFAPGETEAMATRTPVVPVPHATVNGLPRIPRGSHLMAEQDTPAEIWIVRNGKRYRSTPDLVAASGLGGQPTAIVPSGGLDQIPVGGAPYWLGGLIVSDNLGHSIDLWDPSPQLEGSSSLRQVLLTNRSGRPVQVTSLALTTNLDSAGVSVFTVDRALPFTVQPSALVRVDVYFSPPAPGPITGAVSVVCDDPVVPEFSVPLATSAIPIGPHGELQVSPTSLDLGTIRVGVPAGGNVALTNVGARDLYIDKLEITGAVPEGQFSVPVSPTIRLGPGAGATVFVSCNATQRGRLTATLSVHASSQTNAPYPFRQRVDMPLAATAQAPVVFLSGKPLPPLPAGPIRPLPIDHGSLITGPQVGGAERLLSELTRLDFGATAPGTLSVRTFWIRNIGDAPLSVTGVNTSDQTLFGFPNLAVLPAVVAPGAELAIDANFLAPTLPGTPAQGQLEIFTNDPSRPRAALTVVGRASGSHLTFHPREVLDLDSGLPPVGELTITSDGSDPASLTRVKVTDQDFSVTGFPPLPTTLAPGATLTVSVTYNGTVPGRHIAYLEMEHDGRARDTVVLQVST